MHAEGLTIGASIKVPLRLVKCMHNTKSAGRSDLKATANRALKLNIGAESKIDE